MVRLFYASEYEGDNIFLWMRSATYMGKPTEVSVEGSPLCASAFDSWTVGPCGPLIAKLSVKNSFQQTPALDHRPELVSKVKTFDLSYVRQQSSSPSDLSCLFRLQKQSWL